MEVKNTLPYATPEECLISGAVVLKKLVTRDSYSNFATGHPELGHWEKIATHRVVWSTILRMADIAGVPIFGRPSHGRNTSSPFATPATKAQYKGIEPCSFIDIHASRPNQYIAAIRLAPYQPNTIQAAYLFCSIVAAEMTAQRQQTV